MEYELINKKVKLILMQVITENITEKIIFSSISDNNIKNFIGEKIISFSKRIPMEHWDNSGFYSNPNMTLEIIKKYPEIFGEEYTQQLLDNVSNNENITKEFIEDNLPYSNSSLELLCFALNRNITVDSLIEKYSMLIEKYPNIDIETVKKYKNKLDYTVVSASKRITLKDIEENPEIPWDLDGLAKNPNVTLDYIEKNIKKDWNWAWISYNPNLTLEFINKFREKDWDWFAISYHPNMTIEIIEKNPELPWEWNIGVAANPNVTMDYIEKHPEKEWDYGGVGNNPNITIEFVEKNLDKIFNWEDVFMHLHENKNERNNIKKIIFE